MNTERSDNTPRASTQQAPVKEEVSHREIMAKLEELENKINVIENKINTPLIDGDESDKKRDAG